MRRPPRRSIEWGPQNFRWVSANCRPLDLVVPRVIGASWHVPANAFEMIVVVGCKVRCLRRCTQALARPISLCEKSFEFRRARAAVVVVVLNLGRKRLSYLPLPPFLILSGGIRMSCCPVVCASNLRGEGMLGRTHLSLCSLSEFVLSSLRCLCVQISGGPRGFRSLCTVESSS